MSFQVYIDHCCYLPLNLLINIYFVIHNQILSWFLDQFCKRQISLFITDHLRLLLAIKIYTLCTVCWYFSTFKKTFFDSHICIETSDKGFGFLLKKIQELLTVAQRIPKFRTILSPFCHNIYVLVKGCIFNAKYIC